MRKLIIVSILLLSLNLYAGPYAGIEYGVVTENTDFHFVETKLGWRHTLFNVTGDLYGNYRTYMEYNSIVSNAPFEEIYTIGFKLSFKGFFARYEHYCSHPVIYRANESYRRDGEPYYEYKITPDMWLGSLTTVSAGYEIEW